MAGLFSRQKDWNDGDILTEADLEAEFDNIYDSVVAGTTSAVGLVQLEDSHASTSVTKAACPKNVKEAYDLAGTMTTKATWNANSVVKADDNNTPIVMTVGEQTLVGRITAGDIAALTTTQVRTLINVEDDADVTDAINIASSTLGVAAKASMVDADEVGLIDSAAWWVLKKFTFTNLKAFLKTYFDTLYNLYVHPNHTGPVTSAADGATTITDKAVTLAKMNDMATASLLGRNTAATGVPEVLSKATALSLLNVEDGADVTDATNVNAAGAVMTTDTVNVLSDITSTGANIEDAVTKKHAATLIGTKTIDETDIANTKVIAYNSTSGNLEYEAAGTLGAHASSHQNGGADEISVTGLSGLLADDQHVLDAEVKAAAVSDTAYAAGWNGITDVAPSKNAVYDKIETLGGGGTYEYVVTTKTAAGINTAIDLAYAAGGGTALLSSGEYDCTGATCITMKDNVTLSGYGATLKGDGGLDQIITITNVDNGAILGVSINGQSPTVSATAGEHGISGSAVTNFTIRDCYIYDMAGRGINVANSSKSLITGNAVKACYMGIRVIAPQAMFV